MGGKSMAKSKSSFEIIDGDENDDQSDNNSKYFTKPTAATPDTKAPAADSIIANNNNSNNNNSNDIFDPMVVVFGGPKSSKNVISNGSNHGVLLSGTSSALGRQPRRRYWMFLVSLTVMFAILLFWNHLTSVMLPGDDALMMIPKYYSTATAPPHAASSLSESLTTSSNNNPPHDDQQHQEQPQQSLPVVIRADNKLPSSLTPVVQPVIHAAQALQCRESVVSFVINATDGKDECEGLKKAFDKTCGDEQVSIEERSPYGDKSSSAQNNKQNATTPKKHRFGEQHKAKAKRKKKWRAKASTTTSGSRYRRRLTEKVGVFSLSSHAEFDEWWYQWKLWWYDSRRSVLDAWRRWFGAPKDFLFAEDEILQVWDKSRELVENDLDQDMFSDLVERWQREKQQRQLELWKQQKRRRLQLLQSLRPQQQLPLDGNASIAMLSALDAAENNDETDETISLSSKNRTTTKPINLALPTLKKHATGGVIQDVLMLHQGDKLINQTSEAAKDAAASSKAMSDTAAAVSAVLNDPTSVEARTCCTSILNVYHENCSTDDEEQISDSRLFLVVLVMALCGMVKSLIRYYQILWLPEAAGCIIVGIVSGYVLMFFPHSDISFDGHWFLRIMVPPIIFEAALSIDKRSFNRHVVPILLYAVVGTLMATFITAEVLHRGSTALSAWCTPIPYIESLTFGALISSIDPIAVLSVLSNMGMTDQDTLYVLVFGESLLNDGVAIVLYETLVHFLDEHLIIDNQAVAEAALHFSVVALGSVMVGAVAGYASTLYFWAFRGCQTPLVEVLMFFCWALLPYYVCDGIGWSGIVSAVASGFVMDIHIVGQRKEGGWHDSLEAVQLSKSPPRSPPSSGGDPRNVFSNIFSHPDGHLSAVARAHIGFVTGMIATTLETAIFAYLGLFLFSHRYHWTFLHTFVAIFACCISRGIMIPFLSFFANISSKVQRKAQTLCQFRTTSSPNGVVIDRKMQFVLWFAGLRGAMSFALVESIPLYDSVSGEGTPLKPELKAMTSACIMFTVFVLGGYTYYVMDNLGMAPSRKSVDELDTSSSPSRSRLEESESEETLEPLVGGGGGSTMTSRRRGSSRPTATP